MLNDLDESSCLITCVRHWVEHPKFFTVNEGKSQGLSLLIYYAGGEMFEAHCYYCLSLPCSGYSAGGRAVCVPPSRFNQANLKTQDVSRALTALHKAAA